MRRLASRIRSLNLRARDPRRAPDMVPPARLEPLEGRVLFAAGELDPSFAGDGVLQVADVNAPRLGSGAIALPGGKTLVSYATGPGGTGPGDVRAVLARYNPAGSLDATFGTGGRVSYDWGTGGSASGGVVRVFPDGKLLLVGSAPSDADAG